MGKKHVNKMLVVVLFLAMILPFFESEHNVALSMKKGQRVNHIVSNDFELTQQLSTEENVGMVNDEETLRCEKQPLTCGVLMFSHRWDSVGNREAGVEDKPQVIEIVPEEELLEQAPEINYESQNAYMEYGNNTIADDATTEHTHNFVISSSCAFFPEEGHYEYVCIAEGYNEDRYEFYDKYCYFCGSVMDSWPVEQLLAHSSEHGAYGTYQLLVESIYCEPEYEEIWVVDKEEYYVEEEVIECIECGYIQ